MTQSFTVAPGDRVLLLAPHPDDETLAAGGLLQRSLAVGAAVRVVFVTDGENNPWAQRATERRWRIGPAERVRWGLRRRQEALAALACLGVAPRQAGFLGFPDQGLTALLLAGGGRAPKAMAEEIAQFRPTLLASPSSRDLHPDHSALAVMVRTMLAGLGDNATRPSERHYIVHHSGPLSMRDGLAIDLSPLEIERKRRAILCHASQLTLRKPALLEFAEAHERFEPERAPQANAANHPLRHGFVEHETLILDVVPAPRPGAWGPIDLLVALAHPGTGATRVLTARLPRGAGRINIEDRASGARLATGELERHARATRILLPAFLIAGWPSVHVKLERRFGFFDEAGWRGLPPWQLAAPEPAPVARHAGAPAPN